MRRAMLAILLCVAACEPAERGPAYVGATGASAETLAQLGDSCEENSECESKLCGEEIHTDEPVCHECYFNEDCGPGGECLPSPAGYWYCL